jgi:Fe-S oxidoreductase
MANSSGIDFTTALAGEIARISDACTRCGACFEACPMIEPAGLGAADKSEITDGIVAMINGGEGSEASRRWASVCTSSGYCIAACDEGINPRFMVRMANLTNKREAAGSEAAVAKRGTDTFRTMSRGVRMLSRLQLPAETLARINPKSHKDQSRKGDPEIVFYTGCNVLKTPHIALLCLDVLDRLGVRYEVMGGPSTCCGIFQFMEADLESSGRVAFNSIDQLGRAGTAEVLSWCPSCQTQIGEVAMPAYEQSRGGTPFDLNPFFAYLGRRIDDLRPLMTEPVERRVALNERNQAVRTLLGAIPGLELVELDVPRVGTMSNYLSVLPDFKTELREAVFRAAAEAGVDTLATVFHACHREICHFEDQVSFEIVNVMELIGESMGLAAEDVYKRLKAMQDVDAVITDCADMIDDWSLDLEDLRASLYLDMLATQPIGMADAGT